MHCPLFFFFFFFNDTATTEIYTLSLHDALPILSRRWRLFFVWRSWTHAVHVQAVKAPGAFKNGRRPPCRAACGVRSEGHTSELQSPCNLVCRLLLEKKKKRRMTSVNEDRWREDC